MKKLQLLLVALALFSFTALVSCGNAKQKPAETTEEVVEETQPEMVDSTAAVVDTTAMEAEEAPVE